MVVAEKVGTVTYSFFGGCMCAHAYHPPAAASASTTSTTTVMIVLRFLLRAASRRFCDRLFTIVSVSPAAAFGSCGTVWNWPVTGLYTRVDPSLAG